MGTKFLHCPNPGCRHKPSGGLFGGSYFKVYECKDCNFCYCYKCGGERCPNCASKSKKEIGEV